jgi:hypothetical protein
MSTPTVKMDMKKRKVSTITKKRRQSDPKKRWHGFFIKPFVRIKDRPILDNHRCDNVDG